MRRAAALLGALLGTALLLELAVGAGVETGTLDLPAPSYGAERYWRGDHPDFGVWHRPGNAQVHTSRCFVARYRTNSVGARDAERPLRSERPRVVVLGDSFLEGWGVAETQRLSNRLERRTGIPHLNFAMAHFGPYQQLLVYEKLARRFDHASVIASLVPANDFTDLDLERAREALDYGYRYRPYLVGDTPPFRHVDHREPRWRRWLRRHSYAFNAVLAAQRAGARRAAGRELASGFYDVPARPLRILEAVLARLAAAAGERPIALLLIPSERDLRRHAVEDGPDPLSEALTPVAERLGLRLVNLLPAMADRVRDPGPYFFPCDYHWSAFGHHVAAELTLETLGPGFYGLE